MSSFKSHQGVGLVEVLVSLLILSVAVLGFIALQYRAVDAANEALARTQAMGLAKDLGERIRANQFQLKMYADELNNASIASGSTANNTNTSPTASRDCNFSQPCNAEDFAKSDIQFIKAKAVKLGMQISMPKCDQDEASERYCVYVSWGKTKPIESTTDSAACTKDGIYWASAKCLIMEAYQ